MVWCICHIVAKQADWTERVSLLYQKQIKWKTGEKTVENRWKKEKLKIEIPNQETESRKRGLAGMMRVGII